MAVLLLICLSIPAPTQMAASLPGMLVLLDPQSATTPDDGPPNGGKRPSAGGADASDARVLAAALNQRTLRWNLNARPPESSDVLECWSGIRMTLRAFSWFNGAEARYGRKDLRSS